MSEHCNRYTHPHMVVVVLEKTSPQLSGYAENEAVTDHQRYYQSLQRASKVISYGPAMNAPGLCIVLSVLSDEDFREVIDNDPGLISGCFEVGGVVPFHSKGNF